MRKPYVISEDIVILLERWAEEKGFALPDHRFIANLRQRMLRHLECIFGQRCVDMIPEGVLTEGMHALVNDSDLPALSIDKTYMPRGVQLFEINRFVNTDLTDAPEGPRFQQRSFEAQMLDILEKGITEVVPVDDVIFSGHSMCTVIDLLRKYGICVRQAVAGVVVGNGRHALRIRNVDVRWVRFYAEVMDEVCEKDLYAGIPDSGRAVANQKVNTGASYFLPFGKPEWGSIPAALAVGSSKFCIQNSIELWTEIERVSGRMVRCSDLTRIPLGAPSDGTRFVDFLHHCSDRL